MSEPPSKRKRTLADTSDASPERHDTSSITRSEDIYLNDGNIVLVAQENVAFRVHQSQLARHSEVFRNMLQLPGQPQDGEIYDGCPVTRVFDKAEDLSMLLGVLYNHVKLEWTSPDQLISVFRLSSKYLLDNIRTAALEPLVTMYPSTLAKWDSFKGSRRWASKVCVAALEAGADHLLPAAYYVLCGLDPKTVIGLNLPRPILEAYILGRDNLAMATRTFVHKLARLENVDRCDENGICYDNWEQLANKSLTFPNFLRVAPQPLRAIQSLNGGKDGMCVRCAQTLHELIDEERKKVWMSLPTTFNIGATWEVLRK